MQYPTFPLLVTLVLVPTATANAAEPPLTLGAGPLTARCAASGGGAIRVRLMIDRSRIGDVGSAIREIVMATWVPNGLTFDWLEDGPSMVGADIMIAVRHGRADARQTNALGGAVFDNGRPNGIVFVSIDATRAWLVLAKAGRLGVKNIGEAEARTLVTSGDLGAALGHVIAHEVGHVVLATRTHESDGLMKAGFDDVAAVLQPRAMVLDSRSRARLSARLAAGGCTTLNARRDRPAPERRPGG